MNPDSLPSAIMNLPCTPPREMAHDKLQVLTHKIGHRDARHAAAELVAASAAPQGAQPVQHDAIDEVPITDHDQAALYEFTRGTPHHDSVRKLYQLAYAQVNASPADAAPACKRCEALEMVCRQAKEAGATEPHRPDGSTLAINLAIDALENEPPEGRVWPVNWKVVVYGLKLARARLAADAAPVVPQEVRMFNMQNGPQIPWALAEAIYAGYSAMYGGSQTLERLHERSGFAWSEVEHFYKDRRGRAAIDDAMNAGLTIPAKEQR